MSHHEIQIKITKKYTVIIFPEIIFTKHGWWKNWYNHFGKLVRKLNIRKLRSAILLMGLFPTEMYTYLLHSGDHSIVYI